MNKYLKFTFWNSCDLANVVFSNGFQFWFYIDALVTEPEEMVFEEVEKDGEEKDIVSFRRTVKRYRIVTPMIPEFMVDAINRMRLHDNIKLTFTNEESLMLTKDQVTTETAYFDESTCFAKVTIMFDVDETAVKTNCCTPITNECKEPIDCNVFGVLFYPDFLTWTGINAVYPTGGLNDIFLSIVRIPGIPYKGYVFSGYGYGLCDYSTQEGDLTAADCDNCDVSPGDLVLTADGEYWYYDGYYWERSFACNQINHYAVIPPPAYDYRTVVVGRSMPGTFVQMQYSSDLITWVDLGSPVLADDFNTMGVSAYHSLHGNYYFRVKCYDYNCDYTDYALPSDIQNLA